MDHRRRGRLLAWLLATASPCAALAVACPAPARFDTLLASARSAATKPALDAAWQQAIDAAMAGTPA